jgi:hypothetical protein
LGCPHRRRPALGSANLREFSGTYGDWLTAKVSKVFPHLADAVIDAATGSPS